jgi:hypothetical protein
MGGQLTDRLTGLRSSSFWLWARTYTPLEEFIRALISICVVFAFAPASLAGEGAASNYFPGTCGDYAAAAGPDSGWTYLNMSAFLYSFEQCSCSRYSSDLEVLQQGHDVKLCGIPQLLVSAGR